MGESDERGKESLNNTDLQSFRNFFKEFVAEVLGLTAASAGESVDKIDGLMQMLIDMRQQAKTARDFATADSIRDQLLELGFVIKDGKEGTTYTMK